ncbi:hypothetical protein [Acidithiobacillus concretivorus]|uniref:hypothetical protein n=1 Tax=Acidithiobacillus concretivorus TaxID=3063952 RepID=UPI001D0248E3|nr:hypothetical protein [Acidithiobacillus concretivorus]
MYNWWSWYTRLAFPDIRKEAITSRPLLLSAIGRSTKHAGQTQIYLTPMHAAHNKVERGIENIRKGLRMVRQTAEQYLGHSSSAISSRKLPKNHGPHRRPFQPLAGLNCFF